MMVHQEKILDLTNLPALGKVVSRKGMRLERATKQGVIFLSVKSGFSRCVTKTQKETHMSDKTKTKIPFNKKADTPEVIATFGPDKNGIRLVILGEIDQCPVLAGEAAGHFADAWASWRVANDREHTDSFDQAVREVLRGLKYGI